MTVYLREEPVGKLGPQQEKVKSGPEEAGRAWQRARREVSAWTLRPVIDRFVPHMEIQYLLCNKN